MAYRNYSMAVSHIVDATNQGDFTTIQAAITAAVSGQTIGIRPGTYTENLTLKAGVNLVAIDTIGSNVTIVGKCTLSTVGNVGMNNLTLQTNSDFALSVSGSAVSVVSLYDCFINCTNNTGISLTSSAGAAIQLFDSQITLGTSGIGAWTSSSPGSISLNNCIVNNSSSITASNNSAGTVFLTWSIMAAPVSCSGTGAVHLQWANIQTNGVAPNATAFAANGTGANIVQNTGLIAGTASGLSIGGGAGVSLFLSQIDSTNANAIAGTGTLSKGLIVFTNASSTIAGTLTVNTYTTA